jgi:hypothetical protein
MRKLLLIVTILLGITPLFSQESISFSEVEQQTMQHYYASQWDSVIIVGMKGIDAGHDYFYLRVRMGMAYFYQSNFAKAIQHLEKARKFNPNDEFTNSYLYLSYKYMGRSADAEMMGRKLSDTLRTNELFIKRPFFSGMYAEFGYSPTTNYSPVELARNSTYTKESSSRNNAMTYGFVGLTNQVTPWMTLFYGVTSLGTSLTKYTYENLPSLPPLPQKLKTTTTDLSIKMLQFYINSRIRLARGWILVPYYHAISLNGSSGTVTRPRRMDTTSFNSRDAIMGIGFEKYYRNLVFLGEVSSNRFSNKSHLQLQTGITWFPRSNQNLYLNGAVTYNMAQGADSLSSPNADLNNLYVSGKIGGKLFSKLWGETAFYGGNIQNSQIGNGYLFFSTPNSYTMLGNASLTLILKKVKLSLKYQYAGLNGQKKSFIGSKTFTSEFSFNQQTITGGLLWNF